MELHFTREDKHNVLRATKSVNPQVKEAKCMQTYLDDENNNWVQGDKSDYSINDSSNISSYPLDMDVLIHGIGSNKISYGNSCFAMRLRKGIHSENSLIAKELHCHFTTFMDSALEPDLGVVIRLDSIADLDTHVGLYTNIIPTQTSFFTLLLTRFFIHKSTYRSLWCAVWFEEHLNWDYTRVLHSLRSYHVYISLEE